MNSAPKVSILNVLSDRGFTNDTVHFDAEVEGKGVLRFCITHEALNHMEPGAFNHPIESFESNRQKVELAVSKFVQRGIGTGDDAWTIKSDFVRSVM